MYDIDAIILALIQQTAPKSRHPGRHRQARRRQRQRLCFDIAATADLVNTAYLVVDNALHTVDLGTGAATLVGSIEGVNGSLSDIAILP